MIIRDKRPICRANRLLAVLLSVCLLLTMAAPAAYAQEPDEGSGNILLEETASVSESANENDELLYRYLLQSAEESVMGSGGKASAPALLFSFHAANRLDPVNKAVCEKLKAWIETVARQGGSTTYTLTDLGTIDVSGRGLTADQIQSQLNIDKILHTLLSDCPYELYWFDKTKGMSMSQNLSYTSTSSASEVTSITYTGNINFYFPVAKAYQKESNNYQLDPELAAAAAATASGAASVVNTYSSYSDYRKLAA